MTGEMAINVIEPSEPGLQTCPCDLDLVLAETTPEVNIIVTVVEAAFKLLAHIGRIGNTVVLRQVCFELLTAIVRFVTELTDIDFALLIAFPQLKLVVLTVLMALPVILAAKAFGAPRERTAIRLCMALHMLSADCVSKYLGFKKSFVPYLSSHCLGNDFLQSSISQTYRFLLTPRRCDESTLDIASA